MKRLTIAAFLVTLLITSASVFAADEINTVTPSITIEAAPSIAPGPNGTEAINGKVVGITNPKDYFVVVYAFSNKWWVQPTAEADLNKTEINKDLTWENTTHGGNVYAALLVKKSFSPPATYNERQLPKVGGDVIAIAKCNVK